MRNKRMFSRSIVETDSFFDMPPTAQLLYFHLGMNADDDGFIDCPKTVMRNAGSKENDALLLVQKGYIIPINDGLIVVRHWKQNNYIRPDRYAETVYFTELQLLSEDSNGVYNTQAGIPLGIPDGNQTVTERLPRIDKNRLDKNNINNILRKFGIFWEAYPSKKGKKAAEKAFLKLNPDDDLVDVMLTALGAQKQTDQWRRDNGAFIPHPATWLNGQRWADELEVDIPRPLSGCMSDEDWLNGGYGKRMSDEEWLKGGRK